MSSLPEQGEPATDIDREIALLRWEALGAREGIYIMDTSAKVKGYDQ